MSADPAGSVAGRDRLRLFVGLPLPERTGTLLADWQQRELAGRPGLRLVRRDHLHITIAFLGSRPRSELAAISRAVEAGVADVPRPRLRIRRTPRLIVDGYRETGRVAMVLLRDERSQIEWLAAGVQRRLHELGVYRPESRRWLPHVTVARFRERPRLEPPVPDLGAFSPSEVAVYHSVLRPSGAQYDILESVALGG